MMAAEFVVPGRPHGKGRPRATTVNGRARVYTPATSAAYEEAVRDAGQPHFAAPLEGPIKLRVVAYFEMPVSWSKRKREAMRGGFHTQKPDGDNVLKSIEDGLNGIAWIDDCQVADARVVKRWASYSETFVQVEVAA